MDLFTYPFDLNLIDPCALTPDIDMSIISDPINYNVYTTSPALEIDLDPSLVTVSYTSALCTALEFDVVNDDDTSLNASLFQYDPATYKFTISSQNTADTTSSPYSLKIVAGFAGGPKTSSLQFTVNLLDHCASAVLTNPGGHLTTTNP